MVFSLGHPGSGKTPENQNKSSELEKWPLVYQNSPSAQLLFIDAEFARST